MMLDWFMMKSGFEAGNMVLYPESICPCQTARQWKDMHKILERESMRIRKLTPIETERLISWPDNWTKFGNYNGIIKELSDTQRYKICGNGIVSKVSRHIVTNFLPEGEYRVFSTFSGADGSCLLLPERFKKVAFAEFDPKSKIQHPSAVLKYHNPDVPNLGDMTKIISSEVPEFDVMFTSPPCQSFSISGKRLGFEDTRGTLFHEVARIIKDHPECKYLVFENVPGMLSHDKGNTFKVILETFSDLGFSLDFDLYNAKDFGVPQNRSRLFLVGKRD